MRERERAKRLLHSPNPHHQPTVEMKCINHR